MPLGDGQLSAVVAEYTNRPIPTDPYSELNSAAIAMRALQVAVADGVPALAFIANAWGIAVHTDELIRMVQTHNEPSPASGLKELIQAQINGTYTLVPWPFPIITERSRSLLPGSVTVVCGAPGSAKSWWTISCLRYWIDGVAPAAVLMLEETRAWHLNRVLAQLEGNTNILDCLWCRSNPAEITAALERHKATIDAVSANLWCMGDRTLAQCAEWVEERCAAKCRVIIVDPITLADPGKDKPWDADRRFMTRVKVAIEAAGASLVLVSHPRKSMGGKQAGPPTMDDMAGGVVYSRAAASLIWINGTAPNTKMTTVDADGREQTGAVHKTMRIMKARNSTGQHDTVAYRFSDLSFREVGAVITPAEAAPVASNRRPRAARLADKPQPGEDPF